MERVVIGVDPAKRSHAIEVIDEHEKSIQQSAFGINAPNRWLLFNTTLWTWISFPATRHNKGATLSFADGHVETWHWLEPNTMEISATDSDADRAGDALTATATRTVVLTDDDTEAPIITLGGSIGNVGWGMTAAAGARHSRESARRTVHWAPQNHTR